MESPCASQSRPAVPTDPDNALSQLLDETVVWGDAAEWLPGLPEGSVDLFFTSPPYADARSYSEIHPDRYVEWFLPFAAAMLDATAESGSFVLNIKNRVASAGPLRGQRHPYVYELVLSMQRMGWRWIETYIWSKPNGIPGRFGPRTKDGFEYVYHFAKGPKPYFDLDAVRVGALHRWMRHIGHDGRLSSQHPNRWRFSVWHSGSAPTSAVDAVLERVSIDLNPSPRVGRLAVRGRGWLWGPLARRLGA